MSLAPNFWCALAATLLAATFLVACDNLEQHVLIKSIDFEVDPKANNGEAFACHLVVPYTSELSERLKGMDSQTYFSQLPELQKTYKDALEIFKYDLIPGKNKLNQRIEPRSRVKGRGAYLFAKYTTQGRFAESIGLAKKIVVELLPYKMVLQYNTTLKKLQKQLEKK